MSVSDDVDALLLAIFEREQERERQGKPQRYFESAELAAALGWPPERFNRAVEILEKRGLVEVDPTLGSTPYVTRALLLTPEGWLACEKLRGQPQPAQPAQPAGTMPASSMPRDPAEQHALDVVADYLEATAVWIDGRALRSKLSGQVEDKNRTIDRLVPDLLVRDGEYPSDRYRLTLEGALESRHAHAIRQYLGDVLDVLKAKAKRNKTFTEFTVDDIKAGDSDIAEAFDERAYKWLHRVMRIAGVVNENSPDSGPWGVPADIEEVLECKSVEELRALRRVVAEREALEPAVPSGFTPHQQQVLDAVAEHWATQSGWLKGRVLRARVSGLALVEADQVVQSLVPRFLRRTDQARQDDLYAPTLEGVLQSARSDEFRRHLGLVWAVLRNLGLADAGFDVYSWKALVDESCTSGIELADSDLTLMDRSIGLASLGQRTVAGDGGPAWAVPADIEGLLTLPDLESVLEVRIEAARYHLQSTQGTTMTADPRKVFIIHGRNLEARTQMGIFVRSLGLVPINFGDLRASMGGTPTIAEIVERGMSEAQGVIALITADEYASVRPEYRYDHDEPDQIARWQARPNVIFEAGMAFGRDRTRVVFVLLGNPKLFTDVAGVAVLRPTNDPSGDRGILRSTLGQGMHCDIELHSTDWMKAGDFEACIAGLSGVSPSDPFAEPAVVSEPDDERFDGLGEEATKILNWLCAEYIKKGFPNHKVWTFSPNNDEQLAVFRELRAHSWIETMGTGEKTWRLTDMGQMLARRRK